MTSNIGAPYLMEGITAEGTIRESAREAVMAELRTHFRPEFLNRVDDIVLFKPLRLDEIKSIVKLLLERLKARLAERRIGLEITPAALDLIARSGYDPVYGARPLKRFLQREVETRLARELVAGTVPEGSKVTVDTEGRSIVLRVQTQPAEA
jgi:ATP-dependent Clp protease ATP-binding subunit ClpB